MPRVRVSPLGPKNRKEHMLFPIFSFIRRFEQFNATVRRTVACRRLDDGNSVLSIPIGNGKAASLATRTIQKWLISNEISHFLNVYARNRVRHRWMTTVSCFPFFCFSNYIAINIAVSFSISKRLLPDHFPLPSFNAGKRFFIIPHFFVFCSSLFSAVQILSEISLPVY